MLVADGCNCKTAPHIGGAGGLRTRQFCAGFFHVEASVEANARQVCLCYGPCYRKTVTCVARLHSRGRDTLVRIYSNCHRAAGPALHAENFVVLDAVLREQIRSCGEGDILVLYLTYQPCHFSGGHDRTRDTSCTETLVRFHAEELAPRGIQLMIKVCYLYRAHWLDMQSYSPMITNALEGLRLLRRSGVLLEAMCRRDWQFLVGLTVPQVRRAWEEARAPFEPWMLRERERMDDFIRGFLLRIVEAPRTTPSHLDEEWPPLPSRRPSRPSPPLLGPWAPVICTPCSP